MWRAIASEALQRGKRLELLYDGFRRIVEVHTIGETTAGNEAMTVYQVRGGSTSDERVGWKRMRLDEATGASITDEESLAPRPGYQRDDRGYRTIYSQV
jgi:hypothetical protein